MIKKIQQPIVAIVGRPNVGKSTFFNRICGKRTAIESEIPRTTRDRIYGDTSWCGKSFILVDTAGLLEKDKKDDLRAITKAAVMVAIEEADTIIFLIDAVDGVQSYDREIAKILHKTAKKVFLVMNKADNPKREIITREILSLGFGKPHFVCAISGRGVGDFLDHLVKDFPPEEQAKIKEEETIQVAIVGRPNVGKSTLLNTLVGEERAIVSETPGTTRDITDAILSFGNKKIRIIDTAGIRRKGKIGPDIEKFSVIRALRAIKESTVVIVLVDAQEGVVSQDAHLSGFAKEQGKSIVIAVNKFDIWGNLDQDSKKVPTIQPVADVGIPTASVGKKMAEMISDLQKELSFLPYVPVVFIYAKDKININILLKKLLEVYHQRFVKIAKNDLQKLIIEASSSNQQLPEILDFYQERSNPPVFKAIITNKKRVHFSHLRYLENFLRNYYPFIGTPIFIDLIESRRKNSSQSH